MQRNGDDQNHCKCYNNPVTEMPHSQNYYTDCCVEIPVIAQSYIYLLNVKSNIADEKWFVQDDDACSVLYLSLFLCDLLVLCKPVYALMDCDNIGSLKVQV